MTTSQATSQLDSDLSPEQIKAITEEAYTYAYPILLGYGFFYRQVFGPNAPERQAMNRFTHFRTLASPAVNNKIPWINTDTLYSACWLDLRAEPFVLSTPDFEPYRFHDVQVNDWYTMGFFTSGTRNRGNAARTYLIAGPDWKGDVPAFVDEVVVAETWIVKLFTRILVEGPDDAPAINALQDRYDLRPLSERLGASPPAPASELPSLLPAPDPAGYVSNSFFECASTAFISYLNALLQLVSPHPSERALFERFARLGVKPGARFDPLSLTPQHACAMSDGITAARAKIQEKLDHLGVPVNGWTYPLDLRGGRDVLGASADGYLRRAAAARYAIWGPPAEEVVYMVGETDADGQTLSGESNAYTLRFDAPIPAKGFWSLTIYDAATRLLSLHPSGRYKRGDRDRDMTRDSDGSLTLYLQNANPGSAREANWLPIPRTAFQIVARLYWPGDEVLNQTYSPPPIRRTN